MQIVYFFLAGQRTCSIVMVPLDVESTGPCSTSEILHKSFANINRRRSTDFLFDIIQH